MKITLTSFLVVLSLGFTSLYAQTDAPDINVNKIVYNSPKAESSQIILRDQYAGDWVLGFGVNMVGDDGDGDFADVFEKNSSNFSNPLILSAEYYASNQFSFNTSLSFNKYIAGKLVDGGIIQEGAEATYMAFDVAAKYSFRELLKSKSFEPYVLLGAGYTNIGSHTTSQNGQTSQIPQVGRMTANAGFGANYWFSNTLGLNLNFLAKNGIKSGDNKAYINGQTQLAISALYRFKRM